MPSDVFTAMGIDVKTRNLLRAANIKVLGDLLPLTPKQVMDIRGIGPLALRDIEILLQSHKLSLAQRHIGGQP